MMARLFKRCCVGVLKENDDDENISSERVRKAKKNDGAAAVLMIALSSSLGDFFVEHRWEGIEKISFFGAKGDGGVVVAKKAGTK